MRILVLEDDAALSVYLQRGLQMQGHEVRAAGDGTTGLQLALAGAYDLVVLDLSLPCMDGVEVLREMRRNALEVSVLVLTGRAGIHDRVQCLDLGADDYLLKPFSFSELTARCRSLMRRRERFADPVLRQGDLELHRMERKVLRKGRLVELTVKEFALLEYLMMAHGRVCTRSELLREVWQMSPDAGTNVVDVYVNYLRKKLGAVKVSPCGPGMEPEMAIETVRGEGYFLASGRKLVRSVGAGDTAGLAPVVGGPVGGLQFALERGPVHSPREEGNRDTFVQTPAWIQAALHDLCQPLTALECRLYLNTMPMQGADGSEVVAAPDPEREKVQQGLQEALVECGRMMQMVRAMQERMANEEHRASWNERGVGDARNEAVEGRGAANVNAIRGVGQLGQGVETAADRRVDGPSMDGS